MFIGKVMVWDKQTGHFRPMFTLLPTEAYKD